MSKVKIIYFIDGFAPTADEELHAQSFGVKTVFRNVQYVGDVPDEECDGVAGLVPPAYKDYPKAEDLVDEIAAKADAAKKRLAERVAGVSDTPPNEPPATGQANGGNAAPVWGANN